MATVVNKTKTDLKLLNPQKIRFSKRKTIGLLTLGAFIGAFSSYFFVLAANLYTPGLAGISSGISYTINDILWANGNEWMSHRTAADSVIYWIFYILCNIPIIYLTTKWFSARFLKYSFYYFSVNFAFSMFFANVPALAGGLVDMSVLDENVKTLAILFFSFVGGLASGMAVGLAFKAGACAMGLDPVAKHIGREKNINIGPILSSIAAVTTTVFVTIRAFIPDVSGINAIEQTMNEEGLNWLGAFLNTTLFSPEYIGSWLFIISYSVVANAVYSSAKKVEVMATSDKSDEISDYLNNSAYHRGHTLLKIEGGYSHQEKKAIQMIINYDELYDVVEKIAALDAKAFIIVKKIEKIYDIHDWTTMTEEDKEKEKALLIKKEKQIQKLEKKSKGVK